MDLIHLSQSLSPIKTPPSSTHLHSSHNSNFPIIVVAIIGILATALLLLGYYIFVIKCCLNWHRIDILRRFSLSRNRRRDDPLIGYIPTIENRGLEESVIRSIPIFQFEKAQKEDPEKGSIFCECAVCLNEFHEAEKLRIIPNCGHVFHIDCIDIWLQNNANCPLCRTSISMAIQFPVLNQVIAPSSSPINQDQGQYTDSFIVRDEDYVVIELGEEINGDGPLLRAQERLNSGELQVKASPSSSQKKFEQKLVKKRAKKFGRGHVSSMGDECLDIRGKDERLSVQPIRRSFSMDSAMDRQLYLAVQEIVQQNRNGNGNGIGSDIVSSSEGCSNRIRRSFFSFGNGRGSRRAVLPVHLEQ